MLKYDKADKRDNLSTKDLRKHTEEMQDAFMDFEGKELVRRKITQNGTLFQMVQQMQAQMQKMAMIIDAQNGTSVSGEVAGMVPAVGAPGEAAADGTAAAMDAMGRESATSTAGKARTRAAETATPR